MSEEPIIHIMVQTSSSNDCYNGDCDYCLIPMTGQYVAYLQDYMEKTARMHEADVSVYSLECWDATASYFRFSEKLESIQTIDGDLAIDVPRGEPMLLSSGPGIPDEDRQRVDCQTVRIANDEIWWTCMVKHSGIRIETDHVSRETLLSIGQRLPDQKLQPSVGISGAVHPAIQRIHDLLYLDMDGTREFHNSEKNRDADTTAMIAALVAEYIPRPE